MKVKFTSHPGLLLATACMIFSSYFVSIYFSLSFASGIVERVGLIAIAVACTTWAFSMHSVTQHFMLKKSHLIFASLIVIDGMTFVFQFHGWAGYSAELNSHVESNSEFAQTQKMLIQTQQANLNKLNQTAVNPTQISNEIDTLGHANLELITQKSKCPKNSWQCRIGFEQKINANKMMIVLKEQQFNRSAKNIDLLDRANAKLNTTLLDVLNNSGDYNRAHPVFQKMSYAFNNDNKKSMIYQGRALGFLSLLLTILEATLPFYCSELCFDKEMTTKTNSFVQKNESQQSRQNEQTRTRTRLQPGFVGGKITEKLDGNGNWVEFVARKIGPEPVLKTSPEPVSEPATGTVSELTGQFQTYDFSSSERVLKPITEPAIEFSLKGQDYAKLVELVKNRSDKVFAKGVISGQKIRAYCTVGYPKSVAIIYQLYKDGLIDEFGRAL